MIYLNVERCCLNRKPTFEVVLVVPLERLSYVLFLVQRRPGLQSLNQFDSFRQVIALSSLAVDTC